ncbi:MAG: sodium/proline symporter [Planctomycetes bacterium]|nr:sodium/proline symporter [Planctomycetota bacterium]
MSATAAILTTLVVYKIALLAIGLLANRRTKDDTDFVLGGRTMGPLVAAISASASSSSVWTLLGVSGYAYAFGFSAFWLFPACVGGFALNWFVIAPRLQRHSRATDALTLSEVLAGPRGTPGRELVLRVATGMILLAMVVYVAAQLRGSGLLFDDVFRDFGAARPAPATTILIGAGIIVVYTLLGGFWAVSLTDTLQGLMMALTAIALPVAAVAEVGGLPRLFDEILTTQDDTYQSFTAHLAPTAAIGMVAGLLGIGLGYPGQPHVVNRFMALRDERSVARARTYAMVWAVVVYLGMILLGLAGRILVPEIVNEERVFFRLTNDLFPVFISGIMIAAVLSAIMSTADSQLLVAATSISHDLAKDQRGNVGRSRVTVLLVSVGATLFAIYGTKEIFRNVLSAWTAMGAAFGPLLVVTLWRGRPSTTACLATMITGFGTATLTHWLVVHEPTIAGQQFRWISRVVPYAAAGLVAIATARKRTR